MTGRKIPSSASEPSLEVVMQEVLQAVNAVVEGDFEHQLNLHPEVPFGRELNDRFGAMLTSLLSHDRPQSTFEVSASLTASHKAKSNTNDDFANTSERQRAQDTTTGSLVDTEDQARRLDSLNELSAALNKAVDRDEIFKIVAAKAKQIIESDRASVALLNADGGKLEVFALDGEAGLVPVGIVLPVEGTQIGQTVQENRLIRLGDLAASELLDNRKLAEQGLRSTMSAPLTTSDQMIGTVNVGSRAANAYGPQQERLLRQIASLLARTLENQRLLTQMRRRVTQLETVAEVNAIAASVLDPQELLQTVADLTKERFGLYHVHIYLLDKETHRLNLAAGAGDVGRQMLAQGWQISMDHSNSLVARSARTRQGGIVNDVQQEPEFLANPLLPNTCAELAVPLIIGEEVLGVLDVQSDEVNYFAGIDLRVQTVLATQVAVAIRNVMLFDQTQAALSDVEESQRMLRVVIDAAPDQIFIKDKEHRYVMANQGFVDSLHMKFEDLVGKNDQELGFSGEMKEAGQTGIGGFWTDDAEVLESGQPKIIDAKSIEQDGDLRYHSVIKVPLKDSKNQIWGTLGFIRDVTERESLLNETEVLYDAGITLNTAQTYEEIIDVLRQYTLLGNADYVALNYFDQPWTYNQLPEWFTVLARWTSAATDKPNTQYRLADFPAIDQLIYADQPTLIEHLMADDRIDEAVRSIYADYFGSAGVVFVPLIAVGQWIGLISAGYDNPTIYKPIEVRRLVSLSQQAGVIVQSIQRLSDTQRLAQRERTIREITEKMRAANNLEQLVKTAAEQLGERLSAGHAVIELGRENGTNSFSRGVSDEF